MHLIILVRLPHFSNREQTSSRSNFCINCCKGNQTFQNNIWYQKLWIFMQSPSSYSKLCLSSNSYENIITLNFNSTVFIFYQTYPTFKMNCSNLPSKKTTVLVDNSLKVNQCAFYPTALSEFSSVVQQLLTQQCTWRWVSAWVKSTHRPQLFINTQPVADE